ncbi:hypothetical protein AAFF_G00170940 [Aldrovandia affinis]|uniref:Uncharacterized protein n=1 Tax=Aldrovandia affinis TaxID=143900 RepID=A0AAD7RLI3_9TELE|nr:hypothetical protein AAFF_G00170940 [Aldrovandia affinis]
MDNEFNKDIVYEHKASGLNPSAAGLGFACSCSPLLGNNLFIWGVVVLSQHGVEEALGPEPDAVLRSRLKATSFRIVNTAPSRYDTVVTTPSTSNREHHGTKRLGCPQPLA